MQFGVVMVTQMIVIWLGLSSLGSCNVNLVCFWAMRRATYASGGPQPGGCATATVTLERKR
jgi:hypothetical protein